MSDRFEIVMIVILCLLFGAIIFGLIYETVNPSPVYLDKTIHCVKECMKE